MFKTEIFKGTQDEVLGQIAILSTYLIDITTEKQDSYGLPVDYFKKIDLLMSALSSSKPFALLQCLDGYETKDPDAFREFSQEVFSEPDELQSFYTLIVNIAEHYSCRKDRNIWNKRMNSTLYDAIVMDENSIFHNSYSPDILERWGNLGFWEELSNLRYGGSCRPSFVEDILTSHLFRLDDKYIQKGLEIVDCNAPSGFDLSTNFDWIMSEKAIDQYVSYLEHIDGLVDDNEFRLDQIVPLISPYIKALHYEDEDGFPLYADAKERLNTRLVQKYASLVNKMIW